MEIHNSAEWMLLEKHWHLISKKKSHDLFKEDHRTEYLLKSFDSLLVDFSKQKINQETFDLLIALANKAELKEKICDLLSGKPMNKTEGRAALHSALRLPASESLVVNGKDVNLGIQEQLAKVETVVNRLTSGQWRGYSGKPITDVVNLGVGGSDLGPLLACDALDEFKPLNNASIDVHFASTMDGSQISNLFTSLNPETTLFIVVSKSFSTIDTLSNATTAKHWLVRGCDNEALVLKQHFIGVSAKKEKMSEWGIDAGHQLELWDWVGGRFSLWSSVGVSIAIKLGMNNFRALLAGANAMDKHFASAEFENNLPVLLGLIGIWNVNFRKINAQAILPYDARLSFFPDYLTQLEMESNGKSVTNEGARVDYNTCPVLWGKVGPNAQHAFYQLLHQGTQKVNCDFIAPINRFDNFDSEHGKALQEQHLLTLANCFAQSRALMVGSENKEDSLNQDDELACHRFYPGDQPSTTILLKELTPYSLGQLIAFYEHKVFVMASIWNINPFDQWGVELGKVMAGDTLESLSGEGLVDSFDESTNGLINLVKGHIQSAKE